MNNAKFLRVSKKVTLVTNRIVESNKKDREGNLNKNPEVDSVSTNRMDSPECLFYRKKFKKLPTADAYDVLSHFFYRTLYYQPYRDFLVWCPSCACAVFSSRMSSKIVGVCSQYREKVPNTVIPDTVASFSEYNFVTLK